MTITSAVTQAGVLNVAVETVGMLVEGGQRELDRVGIDSQLFLFTAN